MNAQVWESDLVELLKVVDGSVFVEVFPNNPSTYIVKGEKGTLLVRYNSSTYEVADISGGYFYRSVIMEIVLKSRALRGNGGAYNIIEKVKKVIGNYHPLNALGVAVIRSDDTLGEEDGVWTFGIKVGFIAAEYLCDVAEGEFLPSLKGV